MPNDARCCCEGRNLSICVESKQEDIRCVALQFLHIPLRIPWHRPSVCLPNTMHAIPIQQFARLQQAVQVRCALPQPPGGTSFAQAVPRNIELALGAIVERFDCGCHQEEMIRSCGGKDSKFIDATRSSLVDFISQSSDCFQYRANQFWI